MSFYKSIIIVSFLILSGSWLSAQKEEVDVSADKTFILHDYQVKRFLRRESIPVDAWCTWPDLLKREDLVEWIETILEIEASRHSKYLRRQSYSEELLKNILTNFDPRELFWSREIDLSNDWVDTNKLKNKDRTALLSILQNNKTFIENNLKNHGSVIFSVSGETQFHEFFEKFMRAMIVFFKDGLTKDNPPCMDLVFTMNQDGGITVSGFPTAQKIFTDSAYTHLKEVAVPFFSWENDRLIVGSLWGCVMAYLIVYNFYL